MRDPIRWFQITLAGLGALTLAACNPPPKLPPWNAGKLVVIVPEHTQGPEAELQHTLAVLLADFLHTQLVLQPVSPERITGTLETHKAHLAAIALRSTETHPALRFGPVYQTVREQLICNNDATRPKTLADVAEKHLAVIAGTPEQAALQETLKNLATPQWQIRRQTSPLQLLTEVSEGKLDCAVVSELQFAEARYYLPNLSAVLDIAPPSQLAWGLPKDADPQLQKQIDSFFNQLRQSQVLERLLDRYYGHNNRLPQTDATAFVSASKTVLPHYRKLFEEGASLTGEDWRLLAALAYQESQWDPLATSYTNVRGMMMLTSETADRMGLGNRLDARENIIAGARYLVLLKEHLPDRIQEPDRTWFALAAYNQGLGHLEDARILTARAKQNPDNWADVKKWMLRLGEQEIYDSVKHGYARGGEAVALVENIRNYHAILKRLEPDATPPTFKLPKPPHGWLR